VLDVSHLLEATPALLESIVSLPALRELYLCDALLGLLCRGPHEQTPGAEWRYAARSVRHPYNGGFSSGGHTAPNGPAIVVGPAVLDRLWDGLAAMPALRYLDVRDNHFHPFIFYDGTRDLQYSARSRTCRRMLQALAARVDVHLLTDFLEWDPRHGATSKLREKVSTWCSAVVANGAKQLSTGVPGTLRRNGLSWLACQDAWKDEEWWL
jgi:hypothetical protein